ncbi:hypothetical protein MTR67_001644 [Solanum verrucosum]|uniref:Uncharacterized protein n=1 Tax=Solanum verrucosum TaxID=315347 RepID=A0AAF0T817_SOLVR|nr:hypothetical protein MTR67_001469 [Solanum verrucosum]WMV08259.1 hypothetical protein MTR67_001644 [Solanum verrucosum]
MLEATDMVDSRGVWFVALQLRGTREWWRTFVRSRPVESPLREWDVFSSAFQDRFIPWSACFDYRSVRGRESSLVCKRVDFLHQVLCVHGSQQFRVGSQPKVFMALADVAMVVRWVHRINFVPDRDPTPPAKGQGRAQTCSSGSTSGRTEAEISNGSITCIILVDLIILGMVNFDIILGMDWLALHHTIHDCYAKTMTLVMPDIPRAEWMGASGSYPSKHSWLELLKDYDITILYHPRKANVVANALSRKTSSMGSVVAISAEERPLARYFQRLTKSGYFISVWVNYTVEKLVELYISQIMRLNGVPVSIVYDREFAYHNNDHSSIQMDLFEALNDIRCRSLIRWFDSVEMDSLDTDLWVIDVMTRTVVTYEGQNIEAMEHFRKSFYSFSSSLRVVACGMD